MVESTSNPLTITLFHVILQTLPVSLLLNPTSFAAIVDLQVQQTLRNRRRSISAGRYFYQGEGLCQTRL